MLSKPLNDTINACIKIPTTFHIQLYFNIVVSLKKKKQQQQQLDVLHLGFGFGIIVLSG